MKELNSNEIKDISGGNPLVIVGGVWLGLQIADAVYTAGQSFIDGFNETRDP